MTSKIPQHSLKESDIAPQVVQAMQASGSHLWRNNRGATKMSGFWVRFGVGPNGAADFIGFTPIRITPEMVGTVMAIFTSVETKRPIGADYAKKQEEWRDNIIAAGGIAGFAFKWEHGRALVVDWLARFKKQPKA